MCRRLAGNGKTCVLIGRMCRWLADSRKISHQRGVCGAAAFLLPFEISGGTDEEGRSCQDHCRLRQAVSRQS